MNRTYLIGGVAFIFLIVTLFLVALDKITVATGNLLGKETSIWNIDPTYLFAIVAIGLLALFAKIMIK